MLKRGLCMLLAVLTLFALAVPALAAASGAKLAAPETAIAPAADGIKVTWNAVDGSPRYMVYYKENGGSWHKIGTTDKTTYTRKAANLKVGASYQFAVRCCADDKKTLLSGYEASNSLQYTVTLAAPTVTIARTSGGIKATWNAVEGAPRYMVYYSEDGGGWQKIGTTTATSYTRKAKDLRDGVTYQFTVCCCQNDKKTLLSSYKASNSLQYIGQLAAPTVTVQQTSGGIRIAWDAIDGAPRYMVYYKVNGGGWQKIGTTDKTTYTRAAKYLTSGASYQFAVRCCANDKKTLLSGYQASDELVYTVKPAATAVPQSAGTYVLNVNSMKFHRPTCPSAAKIASYNRRDVTTDRAALIAQGYEPCKVCKP